MRNYAMCLVLLFATLVIMQPVAAAKDPKTTVRYNCTLGLFGETQMMFYDFLASHTDKHEFTAHERAEADLFIDHYEVIEDAHKDAIAADKPKFKISAACTELRDAMKKSIKDAANDAVRAPAARALAVLLAFAVLGHHWSER